MLERHLSQKPFPFLWWVFFKKNSIFYVVPNNQKYYVPETSCVVKIWPEVFLSGEIVSVLMYLLNGLLITPEAISILIF